MDVVKVSDLGDEARLKISEVFVDGFYQWLNFFSKDRVKLTKAFSHMFNPDVFYVAVIDGEIAGVAACADRNSSSVHIDRKELRKHLGFIMGTIASYILRRQFELKQYPFEIEEGMGMVEFVSTSSKFRGRGAATAIINHILESTSYNVFALEVADTNTNAIRLYEKLGFTEFQRIKMKNSKRSGVNFLVYMKLVKNS